MFPDKVGALVIDGVLDPPIWSSGRQVTSDRVATQDEFEEFLRLCDEASSECALSGEGGAGVRYDVVEAALLEAPIELEEDVVYQRHPDDWRDYHTRYVTPAGFLRGLRPEPTSGFRLPASGPRVVGTH